MKWHSEYDSIIHIISKKDGTPHPLSKKVRAKGFISFHHSNAYEKDGHIVLDVTASWKQENKGWFNLHIRIPTVKLKIPGKGRIQKFCYIQVIVFDLSYLPMAAVGT